MRRFLAALVTLAALSCFADADLYIDLTYFKANPATNRWTTLQWMNPVPGNLYNYTSTAAGGFWVSNATVGDIVGTVKQKGTASEIRFQVTIGDDDTGTLYASNITSVLGIQTYPSTARSSYSIAAANNRFARIGSGGLSFVPQLGSANLTNWSTLTTNVLGSLVGSSPNALTNGDTRAIGFASSLSVTSTFIANGNAVVGGVIYGNAAGITNVPLATAATTATAATYSLISSNRFGNVRDKGFFWMWGAVYSNAPLRFLVIGDSVADKIETTKYVRMAMNRWMASGGYGTLYTEDPSAGSGNLQFYAVNTNSAGLANASALASKTYYPLTNGAAILTVSEAGGVKGDRASILYQAGQGTSLLVETQRNGGTWGTRATIDTSAGSGFAITNYALAPYTNYNLRITSTGTNNVINIGLYDTRGTTNSHIWAKWGYSGGVLLEVVTNAAFYKFFTNYNPQVVFVECKDAAVLPEVYLAMDQITSVMTNSDVVFITPSPNVAQSDIGAAQRNAMVNYGITNNVLVFDKWRYFQPTNFFHAYPGIYTDDSHLDYKGLTYSGASFLDWMNLSDSMFAPSGLSTAAADISGKANLAGGNVFTGDQYLDGAALYVGSTLTSTGAQAGFNFKDRTTAEYGRFYSDNNNVYLQHSVVGTSKYMYWSNNSGNLAVVADPAWGNRNMGIQAIPWNFYGNGNGITNIPATAMAGGSQGQVVTWHGSGAIWSNPPAGGSTFTLTMNPNQFGQAGGTTNIKSGATMTNINQWGNFVLRSEDASNDITVTNHSQRLKINSTANPYTADTEIGEDIKARTFYGVSNNITGGISAGSIGTTTLTVSGGATVSQGVLYATNILASGYPIDFSKSFFGLATNNTVPVGVATGWINTNWNQCMWGITNTAGSGTPIQISVPAWGQYLPGGGTVPYVTNYAIVLFWSTYGAGTNYMVISR